jgi:hypothetical protein
MRTSRVEPSARDYANKGALQTGADKEGAQMKFDSMYLGWYLVLAGGS